MSPDLPTEPAAEERPAPDLTGEAPAPDAPPEAPAPAPAPPEIVVWGRLAVDQARDTLVRRIEELGYRVVRREDDVVTLASGDWRGRVFVTADGDLDFSHPIAGFGAMDPQLYTADPRREPLDALHAAAIEPKPGPSLWILPSARRRLGAEQQVFDATSDERAALRSLIERTEEEEWLEALPARLDALWTTGAPLSEGAAVVPEAERRAAVLDYWARRPADPFGDRVTEALERWMISTLSEPASADERARYEAVRADRRSLPALGAAR